MQPFEPKIDTARRESGFDLSLSMLRKCFAAAKRAAASRQICEITSHPIPSFDTTSSKLEKLLNQIMVDYRLAWTTVITTTWNYCVRHAEHCIIENVSSAGMVYGVWEVSMIQSASR
jgi:hypothetical protein